MHTIQHLTAAAAITLTGLFSVPSWAQTIDDPMIQEAVLSKEENVLLFRIDGPRQNGTSVTVLKSMNHTLDLAESDNSVGAIVITGTNEYFSDTAGGGSATPPDGLSQSQYALQTFDRMARFPMPIIAAINGKAGQGGLEFAMATDIRIAAETATFSQWENLVGLIPGFGGLQKLTSLVGPSIAHDMVISGRILTAQEALSFGLVSRISPADRLLEDALALGNELAEIVPTSSLTVLKRRIADGENEQFSVAKNNDRTEFDRMLQTPEFQEALQKFLERAN